jgi:acetylornithine deacetylase/succinyl-diaminopimelate desuccinylase-like protein
LEFRLVANQTADDVFEKLQSYLEQHALPGVELHRLASTDPTQSALDSAIVQALIRGADDVYGKPLAIKPRHESSGRQGIWLGHQLGVPGAISGIGPPDWRGHAPDEFILIPYFIDGIKYIAATIREFTRAQSERAAQAGP